MLKQLRNWQKRHFADPVRKQKAWHKYLDAKASEHGYQLYVHGLNWQLPGEFQSLHAEWGDTPGIPADRCSVIYYAARALADAGVSGATADCGVLHGKSSFFILRGFSDSSRTHYVFDSFEGLSEPTGEDSIQTEVVKDWSQGDLAVDEARVRQNLAAFPNCEFLKGWIPTRFNEAAEQRFAMVHVDVDLYEPTRDCYEFFYQRLNPGGLLLCDDYGSVRCPGSTRAIDEFMADKPESVLPLPTGQSLVFKSG